MYNFIIMRQAAVLCVFYAFVLTLYSCSPAMDTQAHEEQYTANEKAGTPTDSTEKIMKMKTPSGATLFLEKAITPAEREKGLMFRKSLKKDHGMLFFFDNDERKAFWMKNTLIPLDIIFLDENFTVAKVFSSVPASYEGAPEKDISVVAYWGRYVLELPAGTSEGYGIEFGRQLHWIK